MAIQTSSLSSMLRGVLPDHTSPWESDVKL